MSKPITKRQFFEILASRSKLSEKTVRKLYDVMFKLIIEELKFNGEIDLPSICKIRAVNRKGKDMYVPNIGMTYVHERIGIQFKVKDALVDFVNGIGLSKSAKKTARKGKITKRDIEIRNLKFEDRKKNFNNIINQVLIEESEENR